MENAPLRLFFALPLPADLRDHLRRWQQGQATIHGWSRPERLHLTLAFLGEADSDRLPTLGSLAEAVACRHDPLSLCTAALGGFPRRTATRVLWLGLEPCAPLTRLAGDLRSSLEAAGVPFDAKPFLPHLTLARWGRPYSLDGITGPAPSPFAVDRLMLFDSHPRDGYRILGSWVLR